MRQNESVFASKICELKKRYEQIRSKLQACQGEDHETVRQELAACKKEYEAMLSSLEERVKESRSPAISALSQAQFEYGKKTKEILDQMPACLHCEISDQTQDEVEAAALYAEYAIDFADCAIRNALIAALSAIDRQMDCEEKGYL